MFPTTYAIRRLAERFEQAYARRHAERCRGATDERVWTVAAEALMQLHQSEPSLPLDPELFVAAQPIGSAPADPWADLTGPSSVGRYRQRVRRIVRQLREELRAEIRRAEGRLRRGEPIGTVLSGRSRALSPLALYIVAHRSGRPDLRDRLRDRAAEQHRSCPLYLQACRRLLPRAAYPVPDADVAGQAGPPSLQFSLN